MTDLRKAAEMALKALEFAASEIYNEHNDDVIADAIKALRQALAQPEPAIGDIRALKHRIHELEGELIGYKRLLDAQPEQEPVARFHVEHRTNACSEVCDIDRKVYATCAWSEGAGKRAQHICDLLNADLAKHKEQA